jgi:PAS domain S-box-containing protein
MILPGNSQDFSRQKTVWAIILITAAGLLATGWIFKEARQHELDTFSSGFENNAATRAHLIEYRLRDCLLVAETLVQLFQASELVEPREFKAFTQPLLERTPEISAIGWVVAVPDEGRATFEEYCRGLLHRGFYIFERRAGKDAVPAGERETFYPLVHMESSDSTYSQYIGFNMGSVPEILSGLEKAGATGKPVMSRNADVLMNGRQAVSILVPFGREGLPENTGDQPPGAIQGFAVAILQKDTLLGSLFKDLGPDGSEYMLCDATDPGEKLPIAHSAPDLSIKGSWESALLPAGPNFLWMFDIADRTLCFEIKAGPEYMERNYPLVFWLFLPAGVCSTLLLVLYLSSITSQRERLEHMVAERTEELRKSEEQYSRLVDTIPDLVVRTDLEGKILFVNDYTLELSGYAGEELVGSSVLLFLAPEDRDRAVQDNLLMHERRLGPQEYDLIMKDGRKIPFEINGDILRNEDGTPFGHVLLCRDITQRRQAEQEKGLLQTRLLQAQKMESIGTLAGGIAHDFNNILSSVLGYSGLAKLRLEEGKPLTDEVDQIMKAGLRARDLIKQILTFSRQAEIHKDEVMIVPIIKETVKLLRASIPATIEIHQNYASSSAVVMADPTQIHQIIMNLFTNAAYAMKEKGGELTVDLREVRLDQGSISRFPGLEPGRYVRISIMDTGSGMPADIIGKIFDPFFSTKERGEGTGMGLSVVHGIVKDMGGTILVYSEPGLGTTFHILLPICKGDASHAADGEQGLKKGSGRILFVDDEEGLLESGQGILEHAGYHVTTYTDAQEALNAFRKNPGAFDLVLTDLTMPKMTGLELAEHIHDIRQDLPIILCTGFGYNIPDKRIIRAGIRDLVMKPMIPDELTEVVFHAMHPQKPSK